MSLLAIAAKTIFTPLEVIEDGLLVIENQVIRRVGSRRDLAVPKAARFVDMGARILAPGFVDIHIHGGGGRDVMEATPEALETVARLALRHGTTSFFPTTLTAPVPALLQSLQGIGRMIQSWRSSQGSGSEPLAEPLGIHLEGPFLSGERRGVHPREHLQKPSSALFQQFAEAAQGTVRILTLAPELEGALELEASAMASGVKVALGHSDATFEQAEKAIEAGASHGVHTFNAMRPLAHRETGILGAILTDDRVQAEVIADGIHVSAPALRLLLQAKGFDRVVLVTDGVSATGMGPGRYYLGEMDIFVEKDTRTGSLVCRNAEGKLAGSVLTQDRAVYNMTAFTGITLCEAARMASWNPARLLGLEARKGCLRPGADADLVVLEPGGAVVGAMARGIGNFYSAF
jgi:N-acetylglucosamine-6-phosphate deacetylase